MPLTPLMVANTIIAKHGDSPDLTHMKVQKLGYYAYGWWLGVKGNHSKLTDEGPQVWRYGPVFRSLYSALTSFGDKPIPAPVRASPFNHETPLIPQENEEAHALLDWIWDRYGGFSGGELSQQTHLPGTPWYQMAMRYNFEVPPYLPMDDNVVESYFSNLARVEGII